MTLELPPISIIIPTFNEQDFIEDCILSFIHGSYPDDLLEIIVVDGMSNDGTREMTLTLQNKYNFIKFFSNTKKIVPAAMNLGISKASHDYLVWAGSHAKYHHDYLKNSVLVLLEEGCASTGGVITPVGKSPVGAAIAHATSSKFGIGNAKYRHSKKREAVDTVFGGCWRKKDILKIGGFNEDWTRNQDVEINYRLRTQIGAIIIDPSIRCYYYCRDSIKALAQQYHGYGFWRFRTAVKHPATLTHRQLAPLTLVVGCVFSIFALPFFPLLAICIPLSYIFASLIASAVLAIKHRKAAYMILMPIIFATLHFSWATGFFTSATLYTLDKK